MATLNLQEQDNYEERLEAAQKYANNLTERLDPDSIRFKVVQVTNIAFQITRD